MVTFVTLSEKPSAHNPPRNDSRVAIRTAQSIKLVPSLIFVNYPGTHVIIRSCNLKFGSSGSIADILSVVIYIFGSNWENLVEEILSNSMHQKNARCYF